MIIEIAGFPAMAQLHAFIWEIMNSASSALKWVRISAPAENRNTLFLNS